ncbi:MAG: hypothetical protein NZM38_00025 [Cytophagales bacterium]|nr:hypothetical protein [Cytophagales bacterium]MDW8383136.1 hypothetical protein [Flammeovirgaceae bacterium]
MQNSSTLTSEEIESILKEIYQKANQAVEYVLGIYIAFSFLWSVF